MLYLDVHDLKGQTDRRTDRQTLSRCTRGHGTRPRRDCRRDCSWKKVFSAVRIAILENYTKLYTSLLFTMKW